MHILICDDDAAFGARMAEYVTVYFTARSVQVHTAVCTSAAEVLATPGLGVISWRFWMWTCPVQTAWCWAVSSSRKCPGLMLVYVSGLSGICAGRLHGERLPLPAQAGHCAHPAQSVWTTCAALTDQRKTLTVHHNRTETEIPLDQIYYLESDLRQINVYGDIARRPICTYYGKIADLPPMLYENGFLQVSRSDVVNMKYVRITQLPRPAEKRGGAEREPRKLCGHPERISGMEGAVCG